VKDFPELKKVSDICSKCLVGKQHREPIPKSAKWRATMKLELIHSDVCGPINPQSNGGNRYFITFTDDFSRKTWVYFLQDRASVFETFKRYKAAVERESGCKIQCLRTDRGGEFTSNSFNEFCSIEGTKRQLTTAYTPQQNGVSERNNRTIMNMVRCLLAGRDVPKVFWPEAVKWATYVLNRSPTLSVKDVTLEETWSGKKPLVNHFRVFGCIAYVHISDVHRKKLNDKSKKCVHLGVSEESKAYKLYDHVEEKIFVSRDVVFEENKGWKWNEKSISEVITIKEEADGNSENNEDIGEIAENSSSESSSSEHEDEDNDEIDNNDETPPSRLRRKPNYLDDYVTGQETEEEAELHNLAVFSTSSDPITYEEAIKHEEWRKAMNQEIDAIEKKNTWELTSLPLEAKKIGVKWIYKTKLNEKGDIEKYKARLVAKGYSQQYGIDYNEVFAPVARWDTIRTILSLATCKRWNVYQLDVKSAFLHGELVEDVYVEQPMGYQKGNHNSVYKLKKALYGLKQAPKAWYSKIEAYFCKENFEKCPHEHTLFVKHAGNKILIVSLYVDDLIYTGNCEVLINNFKCSMKKNFAMTDLGKMRYFLGAEVTQDTRGIFISQQKYAKEILSRFGMEQCNMVCNPIVPGNRLSKDDSGKSVDATNFKQMVGCLMYLLATRPDLAYVVCLIARYMERPTETHFAAAKRILRYLKGSLQYGILYKRGELNCELEGWSDSDYAGDLDDRKNTSGYVYKLGSGAISWSSKKQAIVTLSTTEAEFVAASSCACQGIWLRKIHHRICQTQESCTKIYCDNSSSIKLSKNPILHGRCKHIDVRFHFLRDLTKDGTIELVHCASENQMVDIFTKPLKLESFCKLRARLGVCEMKKTDF